MAQCAVGRYSHYPYVDGFTARVHGPSTWVYKNFLLSTFEIGVGPDVLIK